MPDNDYDVAVIGGGVAGMSTAARLEAQGKLCAPGGRTTYWASDLDEPFSTEAEPGWSVPILNKP